MLVKVERDGMTRGGTNRRRNAGELRPGCAVDMSGADQSYARVASYNLTERGGVVQVLHVHMAYTRHERRMMQKQQCRARGRLRESRVKPPQRIIVELALRPAGHAGVEHHDIQRT